MICRACGQEPEQNYEFCFECARAYEHILYDREVEQMLDDTQNEK